MMRWIDYVVLLGILSLLEPRTLHATSVAAPEGASEEARAAEGATVVNWDVCAKPELFLPGEPLGGWMVRKDTGDGPQRLIIPQRKWESAALSEVAPAIQIQVEIELSTTDIPPGLWPSANRLQLLRATKPDGEYTAVRTLTASDLQAMLKPPAWWRDIKRDKDVDRRRQFFLLDSAVQPGVTYYYRLRFLDQRDHALGESGYCSAFAMALPPVTTEVDTSGFPRVRWKTSVTPTDSSLIAPPWLFVSLKDVQELGRFPLGSGEWTSPLRITPPVGQITDFCWGVAALCRRDVWSQRDGQMRVSGMVSVSHRLQFPKDNSASASRSTPAARSAILAKAGIPSSSEASKDRAGVDRAGVVTIAWVMPYEQEDEVLKSRKLQIKSPSAGITTELWKAPDRRDRIVYPGLSERLDYEFTWKTSSQTEPQTAKVSVVRNPLPTGLTAIPGNGQVILKWDAFVWKRADWVDGPWFVLRRSEVRGNVPPPAAVVSALAQETFRAAPDVTTFTDTNVQNGTIYFYTLEIQGATRATNWCADAGEYECILPVCVASAIGSGGYLVMAIPSPAQPLRIAIMGTPTDDSRVNFAQANFYRALNRTPWIELVERSTGSMLFEEKQIGNLQTGGHAGQDANLKTARPVDLILRLRARQVGYGSNLDVWMEDLKSSRRERLISVPLSDLDVEGAATKLLQEIAQRFPGAERQPPPKDQSVCGLIHKVAIAGLLPLSESTISRESVEDLLTAALSQEECLKVVDRNEIQALLREQGLSSTTDMASSLHLGKLLNADGIVTGFYGVNSDRIAVSARLIEVTSGTVIKVIELDGKTSDLRSLGQQLADNIIHATKAGTRSADNPALRWFESNLYSRGLEKQQSTKTAAYVSPENPEHHFQLGQQAKEQGDYEEALGHFYDGLKAAEAKEDPWRFYLAAGEVLRLLKQTEEEAALWQRAVADRENRHTDVGPAYLALATALNNLHRTEDCLTALRKIKKSTYDSAHLFELTGHQQEALQAYADSLWIRADNWIDGRRLGPSYAAFVRLIETAEPSYRSSLLRTLHKCLGFYRPYQRRKIAQLLPAPRADEGLALLQNAETACLIGDFERAIPLLEQVVQEHPQTIEAMQAMEKIGLIYSKQGNIGKAHQVAQQLQEQQLPGGEAELLRMSARSLFGRFGPQGPPHSSSSSEQELEMTADGMNLLVTSQGAIICRDPTSKQVRWRYELQPRRPFSGSSWLNDIDPGVSDLELLGHSLALDDGTLFVPNFADGVLHAIDVTTGQARWTYVDWWPVSAPVIVGDRLYLANGQGNLFVLGKKTGQIVRTVSYPKDLEADVRERVFLLFVENDKSKIRFADSRTFQGVLFDPKDKVVSNTGVRRSPFPYRSAHDVALATYEMTVSRPQSVKPNDAVGRLVAIIKRNKVLNPDDGRGYDGVYGRYYAIRDLGQLKAREKAMPVLFEVLRDQSSAWNERVAALRILCDVAGAAIRPDLVNLATDRSPEVRAEAIRFLGRFGTKNQIPLLTNALNDPSFDVRRRAVQSLVTSLGSDARPYLVRVLEGTDSDLRTEAVLVLFLAGDDSLRPLVRSLYHEVDFTVEDDQTDLAFIALCKAEDPRALAELRRRMEADSNAWGSQERAVNMIRSFAPDKQMIPYLALVGDTVPIVQGEVAEALGAIGDRSAIPVLIKYLNYTDPGDSREVRRLDPHESSAITTALEDLTGESFGNNRGRWETWLSQQKDRSTLIAPTPLQLKQPSSAQPSSASVDGMPVDKALIDRMSEAIMANDLKGVEAALAQGFDVNYQKRSVQGDGPTALTLAAIRGETEIVKVLLAHGAKLEARNEASATALIAAAYGGYTETVDLLARKGANVNARNKYGWTAMMMAAQFGHTAVVQRLIQFKADLEQQNGYGWTALAVAANRGHQDTVKALLTAGAKARTALPILGKLEEPVDPDIMQLLKAASEKE